MHSFSQIGCSFVGFCDYYFVFKMMRNYRNLLKLGPFPPETNKPQNLKSKRFLGLQLIDISSSLFTRKNRKRNLLAFIFFPFYPKPSLPTEQYRLSFWAQRECSFQSSFGKSGIKYSVCYWPTVLGKGRWMLNRVGRKSQQGAERLM